MGLQLFLQGFGRFGDVIDHRTHSTWQRSVFEIVRVNRLRRRVTNAEQGFQRGVEQGNGFARGGRLGVRPILILMNDVAPLFWRLADVREERLDALCLGVVDVRDVHFLIRRVDDLRAQITAHGLRLLELRDVRLLLVRANDLLQPVLFIKDEVFRLAVHIADLCVGTANKLALFGREPRHLVILRRLDRSVLLFVLSGFTRLTLPHFQLRLFGLFHGLNSARLHAIVVLLHHAANGLPLKVLHLLLALGDDATLAVLSNHGVNDGRDVVKVGHAHLLAYALAVIGHRGADDGAVRHDLHL